MRGFWGKRLLSGCGTTTALWKTQISYPAIDKAIGWERIASISTAQITGYEGEEERGDGGSKNKYLGRELPTDVFEWNKILNEAVHKANYQTHLRGLYDDMVQLYGIRPNRATFHIVIPASNRKGDIQDMLYFMKEMKNLGWKPDTILYNMLIESMTKRKDINKAFNLAREMQSFGFSPNIKTLALLMQACGQMGSYIEAQSIMNSLPDFELKPNVHCYSSLISAYGYSGLEDAAEKVKQVIALAKQQHSEMEEDSVGEKAAKGITPIDFGRLYLHAISVAADIGKPELVLELMKEIVDEGYGADVDSDGFLVKAIANSGDILQAVQKLKTFSHKNISSDVLAVVLRLCVSVKDKANAKNILLKSLVLIGSTDGWTVKDKDLMDLLTNTAVKLNADGVQCIEIIWKMLKDNARNVSSGQRYMRLPSEHKALYHALKALQQANKDGSELYNEINDRYNEIRYNHRKGGKPKTMNTSSQIGDGDGIEICRGNYDFNDNDTQDQDDGLPEDVGNKDN